MKIALVGYGRMGHEIELVAKERGHTGKYCKTKLGKCQAFIRSIIYVNSKT